MKVLICLVCMASLALSHTLFPTISRVQWNDVMPKMAARLVLRLQLQASLVAANLLPTAGANRECIKGLQEMFTSTSVLTAFLYSLKGINDIGDYKSCTSLPGLKYTLVTIKTGDGVPASSELGICGPAKCSIEDYNAYLKPMILDYVKKMIKQQGYLPNQYSAVTDDTVKFVDVNAKNTELGKAGVATVVVTIIGILAFFVGAVCTYADYRLTDGKYTGDTEYKIVECMSLARNAKRLFYEKNTVDPNLEVLNGLRVLSMFWVIFGHTFYYFNVAPVSNPEDVPDYIKNSYGLQLFISCTYAVDVFLFLSGFLVSITMSAQFEKLEGTGEIFKAVISAILHRFLRFLPLQLLAILITVGIVPYMFSEGPLGVFNEWQMQACEKNWWLNLLYFQNATKVCEGCLVWTWYLATDMQIFPVVALLTVLYHKNKKLCIGAVAALCVVSIVAQIGVISHYELSVAYFYPSSGDLIQDYYSKPWCKVTSYLIGMILAWMYMAWRSPEQQDSAATELTRKWLDSGVAKYVLLILGLGITYLCVAFQYIFNHNYASLQTWHNVIFIVLSRPLFLVGVVLAIYPAMLGKEPVVGKILGAPFWNAMAKLSYGAFMFHVILIFVEKAGEFHSSYFTIMRTVFFGIHTWVIAYLVSIVVTLFIESPVLSLDRVFIFTHRREAIDAMAKEESGDKKEKLLTGGTKTEEKAA